MRLVIIRHAESEGNAENRLQGRAEFDLSRARRNQAERLYQRFRAESFEPTHIYSSPQKRTAETAQIVARSWRLPIEHWDELMEHDVGVFSGLTWAEIEVKYPDMARNYLKSRDWRFVEGAETVEQQQSRANLVVQTVIERHSNDDVVAVFTHGGTIQRMLRALLGTDRMWGVPVQNTSVFDFTLDAERWSHNGQVRDNFGLWRINLFNDARHLIV